MAFVSRAERSMGYLGKPATDLGPGSYVGPDQPKQLHAYAPFSSTTTRDQNTQQAFTPGPGSYSTSHLAGVAKPHPGDPLGGERPAGPFASRDERFKSKKQDLAPGPGTYETPTPWVKSRKQPSKQEWNSMNWLRLPSAPSIPAPSQAFGYDETTAGELVMQKNPEKVYEGTQKDCVGPGHYDARRPDEVWKAKGTSWHKSKAKRLAASAPSTSEKVGPGSYNEFQISLAPMYKFRPNAVFASGTKRASYVPAGGKQAKSEDGSEEDEEEGTVPGPGHYFNPQTASGFNTKPVPQRLQFFGSTSSRFENKKAPNPAVGPGTYGDLRKPVVPRKVSDGKAPFSSKDARFQARPDSNPGPGSYKELHFTEDSKKHVWGRQGVFGTTEKRFVSSAANMTTPGPGYYPPDAHRRVGIHNSTNRKPHSVFVSKTRRTQENKVEGPAPGQYEIAVFRAFVSVLLSDIEEIAGNWSADMRLRGVFHASLSAFAEKKVITGTGNPLLAGIGENKKREAAFNVKSQRFSHFRDSQDTLGPGTYDPRPQKDVQTHKPVFIPQASRFRDKGNSVTPGPGSYFDETGGVWNKRSYNILFTEYV